MKQSINNEYITRKEVLKQLAISSTTLWRWTAKGLLTPYGIGGKKYYNVNEIMESFTKISSPLFEA